MKTENPIKRRSESDWRTIIAALNESELPIEEFAKREGIAKSLIYCWRRRLNNDQQSSSEEKKPFTEVKEVFVPNGQEDICVSLVLCDGKKLNFSRMPPVAYLSQLIGAL